MSDVSIRQSHGELKRQLTEMVGEDPTRYSDETGNERHKPLTASEVNAIAAEFGLGLDDEPKQQTMDAIMIRLERGHRTGVRMWDASDLVAVIEALDKSHRPDFSQSGGGEQ